MKTYNLNLSEECLDILVNLLEKHVECLDCFIDETRESTVDFDIKQEIIINTNNHKEKLIEILDGFNKVLGKDEEN